MNERQPLETGAERPKRPALGLLWRLTGITPVVLLAMAVAAAVFARTAFIDALLLESQGEQVTATVGEKTANAAAGDTSRGLDYYVTFDLPDGNSGRIQVPESYYDSVETGDEVPVFYAPGPPVAIELTEGETASLAFYLRLAALIAAAGALGAMALGLYRFAGAWRAVRSGETRRADVTATRRTGRRSGSGKKQVPVGKLEWSDAAGGAGTSLERPMDELEPWPAGSAITVYADPKTGREWWREDLT